jgi:DNA-binding GntR family transcriptional regulator
MRTASPSSAEGEIRLRAKPRRRSNAEAPPTGEAESAASLSEKAHVILEEMIVTLRLPPGSTWSESSLCERIGIGRTPVREALQRLALEQLVQIVPRYGVIVTEILVPEQFMVVEIRRALEPVIASRAARRSSPRERVRIADLRRKLMDVTATADVEDYLRRQLATRRFVVACTRNKFLAASLTTIDALSRRFFFAYQTEPRQLESVARLDADVLQAIVTDNEHEAAAAASRLVDHVEEFTRAAIDSRF